MMCIVRDSFSQFPIRAPSATHDVIKFLYMEFVMPRFLLMRCERMDPYAIGELAAI